tara:strand:+ start:1401 stop:2036 length:636 start_codon:yes stop_codon:yes gene_type:complete
MKFLAVLLLSIAGMYLGYKLRKSSKSEENHRFSIYGGLTFLIALTGGILAMSLFLLKGEAWTIENKMTFRLIFSSVLGFMFVFLGLRLTIRARSEGNKLAQIAGLTWVLVALFISGMMITRNSKMNEGWTSERQAQVMMDCEKLVIENRPYNMLCFKREVMKYFSNFEDYNKMNANESTGEREKFLAKMDKLCPCGENIDESLVESVDLPF